MCPVPFEECCADPGNFVLPAWETLCLICLQGFSASRLFWETELKYCRFPKYWNTEHYRAQGEVLMFTTLSWCLMCYTFFIQVFLFSNFSYQFSSKSPSLFLAGERNVKKSEIHIKYQINVDMFWVYGILCVRAWACWRTSSWDPDSKKTRSLFRYI